MPVHFLTEADHKRLNCFPTEISREELDHFFLLSDSELKEMLPLRRDHNRLGFAVQLCCLRYLGFFPQDLSTIPAMVVEYVAQQLNLVSELMNQYGQRGSTIRNHQRQIQIILGFRRAAPLDLSSLEQWLQQRALEHDKPSLLFEMACDHLRQQKIIRIGTTRLEKMVSTARQQAQEATYQTLKPLLTKDCCAFLDGLLEVDSKLGRTRLAWLQQTPTGNNLGQILTTIDKIAFLQKHGIMNWDLSEINSNRIKFLAKIGSRATNQYLKRTNEVRRYPVLLTFVKQSLYNFTDDLIEMFDQRLWELYSEAKRTFEKERIAATKSISHKLQMLREIGQVLLDPDIKDGAVRTTAFKQISPKKLEVSLAEAQQLIRPDNDAYVDYFGKSYRRVRLFSGKLLSTLQFVCQGEDQGVLQALVLIRELHDGHRRQLPSDVQSDFIPDAWRPYVFDNDGINHRYFELAALWILRQKLRSGDIYATHSLRFKQLERYLIPKQEWPQYRQETISLTGTPIDPQIRLQEREQELMRLAGRVEALLNEPDGDLRVEKDKLVLRPFEAEEYTPEVKQLSRQISERLPKLDVTELLIEVDTWTGFSDSFEHLHTPNRRTPDLLLHLYACLLAQCCNLDLQQMATSTGLTHQKLTWCNAWYIRDETLRDATNKLINYHYRLPLSNLWGAGMLSSSDGQRFPVKGKVRQARALPRYFGYGKGITFYTWTSDQFSQFGFKAIPSTNRDATYVLDEYLNNETELPLLEHTTDTAGYTDLIFALFDLLGLKFSPRLRDLGDQTLFRTSNVNIDHLSKLKEHILEVVNTQCIFSQWEDMLRLAGSLKMGWVTASLIVQKLQAYPRKHPLLRALQEYGRLLKTLHILRWYEDETNRRRLSRQLNKGEALHSLRSHLYFANHGQVKTQQDEQLHHQVGCLNLITNLIIIWNTVYIGEVLQQLRLEGRQIGDEDLMHIWPTRHAHINVYGRHHFNPKDIGKKRALRSLRLPTLQP